MRALAIAAVGGLVLVAAGAGFVGFRLRATLPTTTGTLALPGLSAPVTVIRDRAGVPYIFAGSDADAVRALGFVQAQDRRLFMELGRRVLAGRLAEVAGDVEAPMTVAGVQGRGPLDLDRQMRTLGFARLAAQEVELLAPEHRTLLEAYAGGVNAATEHHGAGGLGGLLGIPLEPWTPADSLAFSKLAAFTYSNQRWEELRTAGLLAEVGAAGLSDLVPPYPDDWAPPVVPDTAPGSVRHGLLPTPGALDGLLPWGGAPRGSNNWVLAGRRTATGAPILANDPHTEVLLPGLCAAHLSAPGFRVAGTMAYGPWVFQGHNDRVAWGITVVNPDSQDFFVEEIAADAPPRVRRPDGWEPLRVRTETIRVRGRAEPVTHEVRQSSHGPLVYDWTGEDVRRRFGSEHGPGGPGSRYATALASTEGTPRAHDGMFALARAQDWQSFREALRSWHEPALNFVYADVDGHIGYQLAGAIPVREGPAPSAPPLGWERGHAWTGTVPFDALPSLLDPLDGVIVTANARVTGPRYPYHLATRWGDVPLRQRRIRELLDAKAQLSVDDVAAVQLDVREGRAEKLVEWARSIPGDDPDVRRFQEALAGWDLRADPASMPATLAEAFRVELVRTVLGPSLSPAMFTGYLWAMAGTHQVALERALDDPAARFFGPEPEAARAARADAVLRAIRRSITRLTGAMGHDWTRWRWGRLHTVTFEHPLARRGSPGEWLFGWFVNLGPFEAPGGAFTVRAGFWRPTEPFELRFAPLYRQVIDLGDLRRSRWLPPVPGQSEHPLSPHYGDQIEPWLSGRLRPMLWDRKDIEADAEATLVLQPASSGDL